MKLPLAAGAFPHLPFTPTYSDSGDQLHNEAQIGGILQANRLRLRLLSLILLMASSPSQYCARNLTMSDPADI